MPWFASRWPNRPPASASSMTRRAWRWNMAGWNKEAIAPSMLHYKTKNLWLHFKKDCSPCRISNMLLSKPNWHWECLWKDSANWRQTESHRELQNLARAEGISADIEDEIKGKKIRKRQITIHWRKRLFIIPYKSTIISYICGIFVLK